MNNMKQKIFSLLVLLVAATGAWTEELTVHDGTATNAYVPVYGFYADAYLKCQTVYPATELAAMAGNSITSLTYYATSPAPEAWIGTFQVHVVEVADATISSFNDLSTATLVYEGTLDGTQSTMTIPFTTPYNYQGGNLLVSVSLTTTGSYKSITWGGETVNGASVQGYSYSGFNAISATQQNFLPKTTFTYEASDVDVTTNAAEGETTFTEAWFDMPAYDATVEYEALRDMSVQMTAQVGDGEDGYRLRIKKNAQNVFEPADMEFEDMLALFTVTDEIEQKSLTFFGQTVDCNLSVYAVDENDQPTGDAIAFADLVPGRYVVMATAATGSEYDGQTAPSNIFELYQGYEVTVPAGEFVTYYKDEALTLYDDEAQLYTITAVSETTATATPFDVIPANVPLLLKNNSSQTRTILLIPTEDPLAFMHYSGFVGSLDPTTIAASTDTQTNYACNGKAFVYVKDAISAGANKAWLEIPASGNGARQLKIVFADATGIGAVSGLPADNGDWFDLNGRKLQAAPTKKGVYIKDGKKVVVK